MEVSRHQNLRSFIKPRQNYENFGSQLKIQPFVELKLQNLNMIREQLF